MRIKNSFSMTRTDYGAVILDEKSGRYYSLNKSAAWVADRVQDGSSRNELIAEYCNHYGISPDDAQRDVSDVIESLTAIGVFNS